MTSLSKGWNTFLKWETSSRDTIDFKKIYVDMAGDLVAGLILSQIVFWHLPNRDGSSRLRVEKNEKMWLAKKHDDWWEECRIRQKTAIRALERLEEKGLIETTIHKFNGKPTNHIRIIHAVFLKGYQRQLNGKSGSGQCGQKGSGSTQSGQKGSGHIGRNQETATLGDSITERDTKNTNKDTLSPSPSAPADRSSGFAIDTKERTIQPKSKLSILAELLRDKLTEKRKIMRRPDMRSWIRAFKKFILETDEPVDDFGKVLRWYVIHIGEQYVPKAYSAQTFVEKYVNIKDQFLQKKKKKRTKDTAAPFREKKRYTTDPDYDPKDPNWGQPHFLRNQNQPASR